MVRNDEGVDVGADPVLRITSFKPAHKKFARIKPKLGLRAWMERVLEESDRAAAGFDVDAVHDLRVALRRCRSLADGLMAIDSEGDWKEMKKAGKKLFQALGELRDMQVMEEWIEKLGVSDEFGDDDSRTSTGDSSEEHPNGEDSFAGDRLEGRGLGDRVPEAGHDHLVGDAMTRRLIDHLHAREAECKQLAVKDLNSFDRKQWRRWARELPARGARVRPGSLVYLHLALEKWTSAYDLHKHALRTRSRVGLHQLRIGIKRFRYTVENFLPRQYAAWGADLKELQDLLGEVHDLDVLWTTAVEIGVFADTESRRRWQARLNQEREKRIAKYRVKMVGRESLWRVWRAELPEGPRLRAAALSRMQVWAGYLDRDVAHSERVTGLALGLYDGLRAEGLMPVHNVLPHLAAASVRPSLGAADKRLDHGVQRGTRGKPGAALLDAERGSDWRAVLQAAALMHDVGKALGGEKHWKASYRMIRGLAPPLGWSARELEMAAVVARYHRGALPHMRAKALQVLELPDRHVAMELAGILRLANALDGVVRGEERERGRAALGLDERGRLSPHGSSSHDSFPHGSPRRASHPREIEVQVQNDLVVVRVEGYSASDRSAEDVAAARHLLETVLRCPLLVRGLRSAAPVGRPVARVRSARI
jgi:CHAD domain-containing protein